MALQLDYKCITNVNILLLLSLVVVYLPHFVVYISSIPVRHSSDRLQYFAVYDDLRWGETDGTVKKHT
jgi:hypothetical protein